MLIITFGTPTNYCTSKSGYKREKVEGGNGEKDEDLKKKKSDGERKRGRNEQNVERRSTEVEHCIHVGQVKTELWYDQPG